MSAAVLNLTIEQRSTFRQQLKWTLANGTTPIDMTGCTAFLEFRASAESTDVLLAMSTTTGDITIDVPTGMITLQLSAVETAAIPWALGVYDLEIHFPTVNGEIPIYRLCKGKVKVNKAVTRGA